MLYLHICTLFLLPFSFRSAEASGVDSTALQLSRTITSRELSDHLEVLASDVMEGRDTGESGQKMAAAYIRHHFRNNGLIPPVRHRGQHRYFQTFYLKRVAPGTARIEIGDVEITGPDQLLYTGRDDKSPVSSEMIFIGRGTDEVLEQVPVRGKVAVAWREELYRIKDLGQKVIDRGADMLIVIYGRDQDGFDKMVKTYGPWYKRSELVLPGKDVEQKQGVYLITPALADKLFDLSIRHLIAVAAKMDDGNFKTHARLPRKDIRCHTVVVEDILETENVLGLVRGSVKPEEVVVVSAHYDHVGTDGTQIFNGADDNGSGTVAVLEIAEAFAMAKDQGYEPYRSVLFAAFTGEERGLLGSGIYSEDPVFPLDRTIANLNIDMAGRIDPKRDDAADYIYLIGSDRLSSELHEINERMNATYTGLVLDYKYNAEDDPNRYYYRSDQYNFVRHNIPSIFYFNGTHEDYHKPTDTHDKIQYELLAKRARLVFHTAWYLANMPERITLDKEPTP